MRKTESINSIKKTYKKCVKPGHGKSKIISLCLEPTCNNNRLLCAMCLNDVHQGHHTAPLEATIAKSKINNLRMHCQSSQMGKIIQQKLTTIMEYGNALYQYIQKKSKKILSDDISSICKIIIKSFDQNSASQAINLIQNPETNYQQIQYIAKGIQKLEKQHLLLPDNVQKITECMVLKYAQILEEFEQIFQKCLQELQVQLNRWSILDRSDWEQSILELEKLEKQKEINRVKLLKQHTIANYQSKKQKLLELAYNNKWQQITMQIQKGQSIANLDSLTICHSNLTKIPYMQPLIHLQKLNLSNNQINRIQNLDHLEHLQQLLLNKNNITKIEGLNFLTSVKVLELNVNKIDKIQNLQGLTNLIYFSINYNRISVLENLAKCSRLHYLHLRNNQISSLQQLPLIQKLQQISLQYNKIQHLESCLLKCKKLHRIELGNNNIQTDQNDRKILATLKEKGCMVFL